MTRERAISEATKESNETTFYEESTDENANNELEQIEKITTEMIKTTKKVETSALKTDLESETTTSKDVEDITSKDSTSGDLFVQ